MAKTPRKTPADEDEAESRRFVETAREMEADGDLNLTEGEEAFERLIGKALPAKKPPPS